jgi:hypothetical protein
MLSSLELPAGRHPEPVRKDKVQSDRNDGAKGLAPSRSYNIGPKATWRAAVPCSRRRNRYLF